MSLPLQVRKYISAKGLPRISPFAQRFAKVLELIRKDNLKRNKDKSAFAQGMKTIFHPLEHKYTAVCKQVKYSYKSQS